MRRTAICLSSKPMGPENKGNSLSDTVIFLSRQKKLVLMSRPVLYLTGGMEKTHVRTNTYWHTKYMIYHVDSWSKKGRRQHQAAHKTSVFFHDRLGNKVTKEERTNHEKRRENKVNIYMYNIAFVVYLLAFHTAECRIYRRRQVVPKKGQPSVTWFVIVKVPKIVHISHLEGV